MLNITRRLDRLIHILDDFFHAKLASEYVCSLEGDRAIEYAFIVENIGKPPGKVLDVGCANSPLTTVLAALGFNVEGLDLLPSHVDYDDVKFFQFDIKKGEFSQGREEHYDRVVLCSTLEHIGIEGRYDESADPHGDSVALQHVASMLKQEGYILLTIPFGRRTTIRPWHRVYDKKQLIELCKATGLKITREQYYVQDKNGVWIRSSEQRAAQTIPSAKHYSLGLYVLSKIQSHPQ